jgi:hypothetical protein
MTTDFFFDLAPVVRLAEHATAAPTHAVDPAGLTGSETPALWLVKGTDGVWLASNGLPPCPSTFSPPTPATPGSSPAAGPRATPR